MTTMSSPVSPSFPIHTEVSFLKGDYQFLMTEAAENKHRFSVMEDQFKSLMKMLRNQHSPPFSEVALYHLHPDSSSRCSLVPFASMKHNWEKSQLGY